MSSSGDIQRPSESVICGLQPKAEPSNSASLPRGREQRRTPKTQSPHENLQPVATVPRAARRAAGQVAGRTESSPRGLRRHGAACFVAALVRWPASNAALRLAFGPVALATRPMPLPTRAASVGPTKHQTEIDSQLSVWWCSRRTPCSVISLARFAAKASA